MWVKLAPGRRILHFQRMMSSSASPRVFPVVVMGATGVGKSKLAIEVAEKFNGEIINADAMQIYEGLDIVTNKVTAEERRIIPHHLMDYVDAAVDVHTVVDFRDEALPVVDELLRRGKTPVICGGTMYYIEALLWDVLIPSGGIPDPKRLRGEMEEEEKRTREEDGKTMAEEEEEEKRMREEDEKTMAEEEEPDDDEEEGGGSIGPRRKPTKKEIDNLNGSELHAKLKECDPEMASRLHPNDKRKVLRALQIFQTTGEKMSRWIKEQQKDASSRLRGSLRYPDAVMLWVESEASVLNKRLDDRVDKMVELGMVEEMLQFHEKYNQVRIESKALGRDYTGGIFQTIGLKEFHSYLTMSDEGRDSLLGRKAFEDGVELLKLHTRQYTKNQRRWINNRFLKKSHAEERIPAIYKLDSSDVGAWNQNVREQAFRLLKHLRGEEEEEESDETTVTTTPTTATTPSTTATDRIGPSHASSLPRPEAVTLIRALEETSECQNCGKFFTTRDQWEQHCKSKRHRKSIDDLRQNRDLLCRTLEAVATRKRRLGGGGGGEEEEEDSASALAKDDVEDDIRCLPCKRKFDSMEKLVSHESSKKHRRKVTRTKAAVEGITTATSSTAASLTATSFTATSLTATSSTTTSTTASSTAASSTATSSTDTSSIAAT